MVGKYIYEMRYAHVPHRIVKNRNPQYALIMCLLQIQIPAQNNPNTCYLFRDYQ